MWPFDKGKETGLAPFSHHLRRALAEPGCPICRLVREGEERWLWTLLYEFTGDPQIHRELASSLGLCGPHAHLMLKVVEGNRLLTPSGVARLYETVVRELIARLRSPHNLAQKDRGCPVCVYSRETAEREGYFLARLLASPEWRQAFAGSDGLCFPHFKLTLAHADRALRSWLVQDMRRRLEGLLARLADLQRKQRYDIPEPVSPEEAASWREALWRLGGMEYDRLLVEDDG